MTRCRNCSNPVRQQRRTKLFLPQQKNLYQRPTLILKVRQHAQLFDRLGRQVLRLVDDQQNALVLPRAMQKELLQVAQQAPLCSPPVGRKPN